VAIFKFGGLAHVEHQRMRVGQLFPAGQRDIAL
jgi:hypothetical protein